MRVQSIAKLIRLPDEKWKHALKRARNIKKYGPKFEPEKWNLDENKQNSHNCYTYFLNLTKRSLTKACGSEKCQKKNRLKPQPGYHAGFTKNKNHQCRNITRRMMKDNPRMRRTTLKKDCKAHHYMGALAVMPGSTYHYYRRDNTGYWSHKDGAGEANQKDADGNYILDPQKAARRYPGRLKDGKTVDYEDFCGYFCLPTNKKKKNWKSRPYPEGHKRSRIKRKKNKTRKKKGGVKPAPPASPVPPVPPQPPTPPAPPPVQQGGRRKTRRRRRRRKKQRTRKRRGSGFFKRARKLGNFCRGRGCVDNVDTEAHQPLLQKPPTLEILPTPSSPPPSPPPSGHSTYVAPRNPDLNWSNYFRQLEEEEEETPAEQRRRLQRQRFLQRIKEKDENINTNSDEDLPWDHGHGPGGNKEI